MIFVDFWIVIHPETVPRTRQTRINDQHLIRTLIQDFVGKKINIVLKDNRAVVGEVAQVENTGVILINMRLKKMRFLFHEINEIYFDTLD